MLRLRYHAARLDVRDTPPACPPALFRGLAVAFALTTPLWILIIWLIWY